MNDKSDLNWAAINQPPHYKKTEDGIECIDAIKSSMGKEQWQGYLKGNVQKYMWRYEEHANGRVQSLEKAAVYLKWLIEAEQ